MADLEVARREAREGAQNTLLQLTLSESAANGPGDGQRAHQQRQVQVVLAGAGSESPEVGTAVAAARRRNVQPIAPKRAENRWRVVPLQRVDDGEDWLHSDGAPAAASSTTVAPRDEPRAAVVSRRKGKAKYDEDWRASDVFGFVETTIKKTRASVRTYSSPPRRQREGERLHDVVGPYPVQTAGSGETRHAVRRRQALWNREKDRALAIATRYDEITLQRAEQALANAISASTRVRGRLIDVQRFLETITSPTEVQRMLLEWVRVLVAEVSVISIAPRYQAILDARRIKMGRPTVRNQRTQIVIDWEQLYRAVASATSEADEEFDTWAQFKQRYVDGTKSARALARVAPAAAQVVVDRKGHRRVALRAARDDPDGLYGLGCSFSWTTLLELARSLSGSVSIGVVVGVLAGAVSGYVAWLVGRRRRRQRANWAPNVVVAPAHEAPPGEFHLGSAFDRYFSNNPELRNYDAGRIYYDRNDKLCISFYGRDELVDDINIRVYEITGFELKPRAAPTESGSAAGAAPRPLLLRGVASVYIPPPETVAIIRDSSIKLVGSFIDALKRVSSGFRLFQGTAWNPIGPHDTTPAHIIIGVAVIVPIYEEAIKSLIAWLGDLSPRTASTIFGLAEFSGRMFSEALRHDLFGNLLALGVHVALPSGYARRVVLHAAWNFAALMWQYDSILQRLIAARFEGLLKEIATMPMRLTGFFNNLPSAAKYGLPALGALYMLSRVARCYGPPNVPDPLASTLATYDRWDGKLCKSYAIGDDRVIPPGTAAYMHILNGGQVLHVAIDNLRYASALFDNRQRADAALIPGPVVDGILGDVTITVKYWGMPTYSEKHVVNLMSLTDVSQQSSAYSIKDLTLRYSNGVHRQTTHNTTGSLNECRTLGLLVALENSLHAGPSGNGSGAAGSTGATKSTSTQSSADRPTEASSYNFLQILTLGALDIWCGCPHGLSRLGTVFRCSIGPTNTASAITFTQWSIALVVAWLIQNPPALPTSWRSLRLSRLGWSHDRLSWTLILTLIAGLLAQTCLSIARRICVTSRTTDAASQAETSTAKPSSSSKDTPSPKPRAASIQPPMKPNQPSDESSSTSTPLSSAIACSSSTFLSLSDPHTSSGSSGTPESSAPTTHPSRRITVVSSLTLAHSMSESLYNYSSGLCPWEQFSISSTAQISGSAAAGSRGASGRRCLPESAGRHPPMAGSTPSSRSTSESRPTTPPTPPSSAPSAHALSGLFSKGTTASSKAGLTTSTSSLNLASTSKSSTAGACATLDSAESFAPPPTQTSTSQIPSSASASCSAYLLATQDDEPPTQIGLFVQKRSATTTSTVPALLSQKLLTVFSGEQPVSGTYDATTQISEESSTSTSYESMAKRWHESMLSTSHDDGPLTFPLKFARAWQHFSLSRSIGKSVASKLRGLGLLDPTISCLGIRDSTLGSSMASVCSPKDQIAQRSQKKPLPSDTKQPNFPTVAGAIPVAQTRGSSSNQDSRADSPRSTQPEIKLPVPRSQQPSSPIPSSRSQPSVIAAKQRVKEMINGSKENRETKRNARAMASALMGLGVKHLSDAVNAVSFVEPQEGYLSYDPNRTARAASPQGGERGGRNFKTHPLEELCSIPGCSTTRELCLAEEVLKRCGFELANFEARLFCDDADTAAARSNAHSWLASLPLGLAVDVHLEHNKLVHFQEITSENDIQPNKNTKNSSSKSTKNNNDQGQRQSRPRSRAARAASSGAPSSSKAMLVRSTQQRQSARAPQITTSDAAALRLAYQRGDYTTLTKWATDSRLSQDVRRKIIGRLSELARASVARAPAPRAPINDAAYNHLYAVAGAPSTMPKPKPFYQGPTGLYRYGYVSGSSAVKTVVIAAGETNIVQLSPYSRETPVRAWNNTDSTAAIGHFAAGAYADTNTGMAGGAPWLVHQPFSFFEDGLSVKSAPYDVYLPTTERQPPIVQMLAGGLTVELATPYDGMATVYTLSSGDAPGIVGRRSGRHIATNDDNAAALPVGHHTVTYPCSQAGVVAPADFIASHGRCDLVGGNQKRVYRVHSEPDSHWYYGGEFDGTDAPLGGSISFQKGAFPRKNIVASYVFGTILVKNTSSVPITMSIHGFASYAVLLQTDDGVRGVSAFASQATRSAPYIQQHLATGDLPTIASFVGTSREHVGQKIAEAVKAVGGELHAAAAAASQAVQHHPVEAAAAVAGASLWYSKFLNGARAVAGAAEAAASEAAAIGTKIVPTIEGLAADALPFAALL